MRNFPRNILDKYPSIHIVNGSSSPIIGDEIVRATTSLVLNDVQLVMG